MISSRAQLARGQGDEMFSTRVHAGEIATARSIPAPISTSSSAA